MELFGGRMGREHEDLLTHIEAWGRDRLSELRADAERIALEFQNADAEARELAGKPPGELMIRVSDLPAGSGAPGMFAVD